MDTSKYFTLDRFKEYLQVSFLDRNHTRIIDTDTNEGLECLYAVAKYLKVTANEAWNQLVSNHVIIINDTVSVSYYKRT